MSRPLAGLRVLDLSRLLPGPFCTMVLADLGATVDKIEDPGGGDYLRLMPPQVDGMNSVFRTLNRGKRSAVLDLKKDEGRETLRRLAARADVLVESFRPGVMNRLGLGYDTLAAANPRLIYCAITGYGQDGPAAHRAGHDLDYLALAGVLGFTGPENQPPQVPGVQIADVGGGALFGVVGILAALAERASTGRGRLVDVSMCEGSLAFAIFGFGSALAGSAAPRGGEVLMGGIAPYRTYQTKDGKYVALGALEPKFWMTFCAGVGLDAQMEALMPGPHQSDWMARVAAKIAERTRDEWIAFAMTHDCCLEPVLEPREVPSYPQHVARRTFVAGPDGIPQPRTPVGPRDEQTAAPAPAHGQHTAEILAELDG